MSTVLMPKLSDSMEEGTIVAWLVADGVPVRAGEEIVEIETDKATMVYAAEGDGLLRHLAAEGATVRLGDPIASIGADAVPAAEAARVPASPLARRVAADLGVALEGLVGTGPRGRIVRADVLSAGAGSVDPGSGVPAPAVAAPAVQPAPAPSAVADGTPPPGPATAAPAPPATAAPAPAGTTLQPFSRMQALIARRMVESHAEVPDFAAEVDVDMEEAVELRGRLRALEPGAPVPSFNDMVVRACALALRAFPRANASYSSDGLVLHDGVHVGVAVAAGDTLLVPAVRDADARALGSIAAETRALTSRAREGTLTARELTGSTFAVSNLGMFGVRAFTAVIDQPNAAILAVGAVEQRAVVRGGEVVPRHVMTVRLSCDHRVLYGADAARFLVHVQAALEQPLRLL
jgi:pyruvate dehydrogenase E2 component (dihydrolipoamide acetyltransferase)